jgi:hypothetical protein
MKYKLTLIVDPAIINPDWLATFLFDTYSGACNYGKTMVESGYEIKIEINVE